MHGRREGFAARHFSMLLTIMLVAAVGLAAQTDDEEVFAPFVSQIRLAVRDPQIRVSWDDAVDVVTTYRVYRSTEPITNSTFGQAELVGTVDPGTEGFVDVPEEPGSYYYAVVAENAAGDPYPVIIPGRNASFNDVVIENIATEAERAARIRRIAATVVSAQGQDAVEVTATASRGDRNLAVYRSTEPIAEAADLADASLVREVRGEAVRVVDLPVPGVPYYYAAVDEALLLSGGATFTPGDNATVEPVEIPLRASEEPAGPATTEAPAAEPVATGSGQPSTESGTGEPAPQTANAPPQPVAAEPEPADEPLVIEPAASATRPIPLPFLQLQSQLATGRRLGDPRILIPQRTELSSRTRADVDALLSGLEPRPKTAATPTLLDEDRLPEPEGAEYTLRTILDGPFSRMAWESAIEQLDNYMTLPLTPELASRAHFYRAQAYYFLGDDRRAILEFLLARDNHFVEVETWLDRILSSDGA